MLLLRHFDICSVSFPTFGHVFVVPQSYPVRLLRSTRLRICGVCTYSKQYTYLDYFAMNLVFSHTWHWYIYRVRVYHTQVVSDHSILRRVGMMIHTRRARHCVLAACWVSGCTINIYLLSPSLGTSTRHGNTAHTYFCLLYTSPSPRD